MRSPRKLFVTTSLTLTTSFANSMPSGVPKLTVMLSLEVLQSLNTPATLGLVLPSGRGPRARISSMRAEDSIRMTSAPKFARGRVARGPAIIQPKSATRIPASGRRVELSFILR